VIRLVTAAAVVSIGRGRRGDAAVSGAGLRAPGESGADAAQPRAAGLGEILPEAVPPAARTVPAGEATGRSGADASASAAGERAEAGAATAEGRPGVSAQSGGGPAGEAADRSGAGASAAGQRSGVSTQFGGLPYLLHLVERCGLPERATKGELADAGLVRVLYEIGLRILDRLPGTGPAPDPEDAALACLCGRAPTAGWLAGLEAGELDAEAARLTAGEVERLIAALRATLEPSELAAAPEEQLLNAVCRRRGRIVAEPGWIDVQLELVEVSTDIRRAGLDLNLGYRPWLGCVVRFVYD